MPNKQNERLRDALRGKGMTPAELAAKIDVDVKTVERWITKGRPPYPKHRYSVAALLSQSENYLWPNALKDDRKALVSESEIVHIYPRRNSVPPELWRRLFNEASEHIDVLAFGGVFPFDHDPTLIKELEQKAVKGLEARLLVGDPSSKAVALRGIEEGIGGAMTARVANTLAHFDNLKGTPRVEVRSHATALYNSIYRFDREMLVNTHVWGFPAAHNPVVHLRQLSGGTMFDLYRQSFERVWATGNDIWANGAKNDSN
ncbi:MAG: helix-turn-helix domain-containing protein [Stackebrandtia sp.]